MTITTDTADTGEIPTAEPTRDLTEPARRIPGETLTRIHIDTGEKTQRIDPRLIHAPSFDAVPRKVIDLDDTVTYRLPETIGIVGQAAAQPIAPWERVAGLDDTAAYGILHSLAGARADLAGELEGPQSPPTPLPPIPPTPPKGYEGRHRHPGDVHAEPGALPTFADLARIAEPARSERWVSAWWGLAIAVAVSAGIVAGVVWAASVVIP